MAIHDQNVKIGADAIEKLCFPDDILPLGIEGRKLIAETVLRALAEANRSEQRPLVYRMHELDDWGMIRNADGSMFATVRRPTTSEEDAAARENGTDPYEALGRMLVEAASGIMSEPRSTRREIIDSCAYIAAEEKALADIEAEDIRGSSWERAEARYRAQAAERILNRITMLEDTVVPHHRHEDDLAVDRFADAMKSKLAKKRLQGYGGWSDPEDCSGAFLSDLLSSHVEKGDPVDVANFSMMLHQRGERIANDRERFVARMKAGGSSFEMPSRERMREKIAAAPDIETEAGAHHPEAP